MLVTMTHEDRPGIEEVVEQIAYRYTWYQEGWRSADDPTWQGAGNTPPTPHASDEHIHSGGQLLARAVLSADPAASSSSTPLVVPGLSITFPCPERPFNVRAIARLLVTDNAALGIFQLYTQIGAAAATIQAADGLRAGAANELKIVTAEIPVPGPQVTSPNSPDWHKPNPGDMVTYSCRIARASGTGSVAISVDNALLGKGPGFIEAVTR